MYARVNGYIVESTGAYADTCMLVLTPRKSALACADIQQNAVQP
jgi:hypothetical protein